MVDMYFNIFFFASIHLFYFTILENDYYDIVRQLL